MTMHAIQLDSNGLAFLPTHSRPEALAGETLVQISKAGICETDLQLAKGYMGFEGILGHEFVGVARSGPFAGQRVVGEINCYCHKCPVCLSGRPTHCPNRTVVGIDRHDGAFAQWLSIPDHIVHPVPDEVDDDHAVFVEPLAAAFQILEQVSVRSSDRVAILGDGRLAYLSARVLALACNVVDVFGKHDAKLQRFADRGHQATRIDPREFDVLPESVFDLVVDCTGSTSGLPIAIRLVRPRGTIVMKTTVAGEHHQSLAAIVIDEINLVGSRCGPFKKAIEALETGAIDVGGLITHRFRLNQVSEAFVAAKHAEAFKVVFEIS